jgi:hypothetical protein
MFIAGASNLYCMAPLFASKGNPAALPCSVLCSVLRTTPCLRLVVALFVDEWDDAGRADFESCSSGRLGTTGLAAAAIAWHGEPWPVRALYVFGL